MSKVLRVVLATMPLCIAVGCSSPSAGDLAATSQSHLADQSAHLDAAAQHLSEAHNRLAGQADLHDVGQELDAGIDEVQQARAAGQLVQQDVEILGGSAEEWQQEIDSQRNDWLGPRVIRLRNRLILISILVGVGAALLRFGPLLGGPVGGAAIVAGHVLTVFALPLFRLAWVGIVRVWTWGVDLLEKLGDRASAAQKATTPTTKPSGATNAPAGSD
jgi:hypothetical protein